jgi:hypothetical protein
MFQGILHYTAKLPAGPALPFERLTLSGEDLTPLNDPATLLVDGCVIHHIDLVSDPAQGSLRIDIVFQGANSQIGVIEICDEAAARVVNQLAEQFGVIADLIPGTEESFGVFSDLRKEYG